MKYLLVVGPQDIEISVQSIASIFNTDYESYICVVTSSWHFKFFFRFNESQRFNLIDEDELYEGLTKNKIEKILFERIKNKDRAGWYFQQFLKMAYALTCNDDYYIVWDSDTLLLNRIDFLDIDNKMILYYQNLQEHKPYLYLIDEVFSLHDFSLVTDRSYVVEKMIIKKSYMQELINVIETNSRFNNNFYEVLLFTIDLNVLSESGFSEFSLYGHYLINFHIDEIVEREVSHFRFGKRYIGSKPNFTDILWCSKSYDSISFEKWDSQLKLNKFDSFVRDSHILSFDLYVKMFPISLRKLIRLNRQFYKLVRTNLLKFKSHKDNLIKFLQHLRTYITRNVRILHKIYISYHYLYSLISYNLYKCDGELFYVANPFSTASLSPSKIIYSINKGVNPDYFRFSRSFFSSRWRIFGITRSGDWDLKKFDFKTSCTYIDFKKKVMKDPVFIAMKYCQNQIYEESFFWTEKRWLKRINSVASLGYQSFSDRGELPTDEVEVAISRDGEICFIDGGHRLSIAKELNLERIFVVINLVHKEFLDTYYSRNHVSKPTPQELIDFALQINTVT